MIWFNKWRSLWGLVSSVDVVFGCLDRLEIFRVEDVVLEIFVNLQNSGQNLLAHLLIRDEGLNLLLHHFLETGNLVAFVVGKNLLHPPLLLLDNFVFFHSLDVPLLHHGLLIRNQQVDVLDYAPPVHFPQLDGFQLLSQGFHRIAVPLDFHNHFNVVLQQIDQRLFGFVFAVFLNVESLVQILNPFLHVDLFSAVDHMGILVGPPRAMAWAHATLPLSHHCAELLISVIGARADPVAAEFAVGAGSNVPLSLLLLDYFLFVLDGIFDTTHGLHRDGDLLRHSLYFPLLVQAAHDQLVKGLEGCLDVLSFLEDIDRHLGCHLGRTVDPLDCLLQAPRTHLVEHSVDVVQVVDLLEHRGVVHFDEPLLVFLLHAFDDFRE